jgi:SAM-dependent methyltransferase
MREKYLPVLHTELRDWLYRLKLRIAFRWLLEAIRRYKAKDIIEIGYGPGILASLIMNANPNANYIGFDLDPKGMKYATNYNRRRVFHQGNATNLKVEDSSKDLYLAMHVIEHVENPKDMLKEAYRVLRSNGVLCLATPNLGCFSNKLSGNHWIGFEDPTHISLKSDQQWRSLIKEEGFELVKDGSTGIRGSGKVATLFFSPLNLFVYSFGFLNWSQGDAYCVIARKK